MSNEIETIIKDVVALAGRGLCHADDMQEAADAIRSYERFCADCGEPAFVTQLDTYGVGKPEDYCGVCYLANNAPGVDHPVYTHVYGEEAQVTTLLDSDKCDNCGVYVIDGIRHGEHFIKEQAEWDAFMATPESAHQPQSKFYVAPTR